MSTFRIRKCRDSHDGIPCQAPWVVSISAKCSRRRSNWTIGFMSHDLAIGFTRLITDMKQP